MHVLGIKSSGTERFQKEWTRLLTTWLTGDLRSCWANNKIPLWAMKLSKPQRNKEMHFTSPSSHWRNYCVCTFTRGISKGLPSKFRDVVSSAKCKQWQNLTGLTQWEHFLFVQSYWWNQPPSGALVIRVGAQPSSCCEPESSDWLLQGKPAQRAGDGHYHLPFQTLHQHSPACFGIVEVWPMCGLALLHLTNGENQQEI